MSLEKIRKVTILVNKSQGQCYISLCISENEGREESVGLRCGSCSKSES